MASETDCTIQLSLDPARSINPFAGRWLNENYVAWTETESSLQRASMYASYASVCGAHQVKPVSTASFGKAVRATFPGLKTRRLGTRKNSRYCCEFGLSCPPSLTSSD